jgi:hypothetical protein
MEIAVINQFVATLFPPGSFIVLTILEKSDVWIVNGSKGT